MNKCINICYIDDRNDPLLSRYLDEYCEKYNDENTSFELICTDYTFEMTDNYKTLLSNSLINKSNIIVIDSKLFENEQSSLSKFTGEQFKIILRQVLPFIKTIVVSQNPTGLGSDTLTIQKFQSARTDTNYKEHYEKSLGPILNQSILQTIEEQEILNTLELEDEIDSLLLGTIQSTISGIRDTALFEKNDLDELVKLFNEVKVTYGN